MIRDLTYSLSTSVFLEIGPAEKLASAFACREQSWWNRHLSKAEVQAVDRCEWSGSAPIGFPHGKIQPHKLNQLNMSGRLVRDGNGVTMPLSKVLHAPSDRQLFLDLINATVIQPKS